MHLNTEQKDDGIRCTYTDGRYAGIIKYVNGSWRACPASNMQYQDFLSLPAAEFYMLAFAVEATYRR